MVWMYTEKAKNELCAIRPWSVVPTRRPGHPVCRRGFPRTMWLRLLLSIESGRSACPSRPGRGRSSGSAFCGGGEAREELGARTTWRVSARPADFKFHPEGLLRSHEHPSADFKVLKELRCPYMRKCPFRTTGTQTWLLYS